MSAPRLFDCGRAIGCSLADLERGRGRRSLVEIRHGLPVWLRAFPRRLRAGERAAGRSKPEPPLESTEPGRWTGDIESRAWPIPFPIDGPIRVHFDFDHAGTRLFVVYASGMIATWELTSKRMEVLPRPVLDRKILVKWLQILGVRDGLTLIGIFGKRLVIVHYDVRARTCRTMPLPEGVPECRLAPLSGHYVALLREIRGLGFVDVHAVVHRSTAPGG